MQSSSSEPPARWYVVAFHYQFGALACALAILPLIGAVINQQRVLPQFVIWLFAITAVPVFGYFGFRLIRSAVALQSGDTTYDPIIGPPMKANCISMGCGGILLFLMGLSFMFDKQVSPALGATLMFMALFALFGSLCGFLWSTDSRRSR